MIDPARTPGAVITVIDKGGRFKERSTLSVQDARIIRNALLLYADAGATGAKRVIDIFTKAGGLDAPH